MDERLLLLRERVGAASAARSMTKVPAVVSTTACFGAAWPAAP
jgi:hypothetical protein